MKKCLLCWTPNFFSLCIYAFTLVLKTRRGELKRKTRFLFTSLSFQCSVYLYACCLSMHCEGCKLSRLRNGCSFLPPNVFHKTISLAPFCLISSCTNLFILDRVMKMLIVAVRFFLLLWMCNSTVTALPLRFLNVLPIRALFLSVFPLMRFSFLTVVPAVCKCLIFSWAATWPRQWCSSNCLWAAVDFWFSSQVDVQTASGVLFASPATFWVVSWLPKEQNN